VGHLLTAVDALELLALDRIILIPNAVQPLKGPSVAPAEHRLAMLRLLVQGDARFEVDEIELRRDGLSFTVETLEELALRHRGAKLFLLVGEDVPSALPQWRNPERVLELATLAVMRRMKDVREGAATARQAAQLPPGATVVPTRIVEVSSSEIRERVKLGRSLAGFVNEGIAAYIARHGLYADSKQ
jgi:nicotinate-nucleotide adenylyltransferase